MPKGLPTSEQLWNGEVSFFSIDTDLIQSAGYNFNSGLLNQIPNQLPSTMQLQLTEVVLEEIVSHRLKPIEEAIESFKKAASSLKHKAKLPLDSIESEFNKIDAKEASKIYYKKQVQEYANRCRGGILEISGENITQTLFNLYFQNSAPFGKRKDKKSEFPDAASLVLLENHAKDYDTLGIIASGDQGWESYAETSERLFYIKSIDDLTNLFAASNEHAETLKSKIQAAINDTKSTIRDIIDDAIQTHFANAEWDTSEISSYAGRVESEVYDTDISSCDIESNDANIWHVEGEPSNWIIELEAHVTIDVSVDIQFFVWDSIDREEIGIGGNTREFPMEIDLKVFLNLSNVKLDSSAEDWQVEAEIDEGSYALGSFDIDPDFSD